MSLSCRKFSAEYGSVEILCFFFIFIYGLKSIKCWKVYVLYSEVDKIVNIDWTGYLFGR